MVTFSIEIETGIVCKKYKHIQKRPGCKVRVFFFITKQSKAK